MLCKQRERGNPSSGALTSSLRRVSPPVSTSKEKGVVFLTEADPRSSPLPAQMCRLESDISTILAKPQLMQC